MELPTIPQPPADYGFLVALLCSLLAFGLVLSVIAGRWAINFGKELIGELKQRADDERKRADAIGTEHKAAWAASEQAKRERSERLHAQIDEGHGRLLTKIEQVEHGLEDRLRAVEDSAKELDFRIRGLEQPKK